MTFSSTLFKEQRTSENIHRQMYLVFLQCLLFFWVFWRLNKNRFNCFPIFFYSQITFTCKSCLPCSFYHLFLLVNSTFIVFFQQCNVTVCAELTLSVSLFLSATAPPTPPSSRGSHSNRQDQFSANWASGNYSAF